MTGPEFMIGAMVLSIPLLAVLGKSEIGRAIADAIRHNSGANEGAAARRELEQMQGEVEQLRTELDDIHAQLLETHERLDFAERLLINRGDDSQLPLHRTPV